MENYWFWGFCQNLWFIPIYKWSVVLPKSTVFSKICSFYQFINGPQFLPKSTVFQHLKILVKTADLGKLWILRFLPKAMVLAKIHNFTKICGLYQFINGLQCLPKSRVFQDLQLLVKTVGFEVFAKIHSFYLLKAQAEMWFCQNLQFLQNLWFLSKSGFFWFFFYQNPRFLSKSANAMWNERPLA